MISAGRDGLAAISVEFAYEKRRHEAIEGAGDSCFLTYINYTGKNMDLNELHNGNTRARAKKGITTQGEKMKSTDILVAEHGLIRQGLGQPQHGAE